MGTERHRSRFRAAHRRCGYGCHEAGHDGCGPGCSPGHPKAVWKPPPQFRTTAPTSIHPENHPGHEQWVLWLRESLAICRREPPRRFSDSQRIPNVIPARTPSPTALVHTRISLNLSRIRGGVQSLSQCPSEPGAMISRDSRYVNDFRAIR